MKPGGTRGASALPLRASAVTLFRLTRWAEMAARLPVRPVIVVVMTTAIMVAIVFSIMIPGGNCSSRCRTNGAAENGTISATYLVADGSANCSADTATQRGVGGVVRNGTQ